MPIVGTHNQVRVRLVFEMPPPLTPLSRCYMFLINQSVMKCVADVEHAIAEKFGYSSSTSLALSIGKYMLLSNENVQVIREDDELTVGIRVEDSIAFVDLLSLPEFGNNTPSSLTADQPAMAKPKSRKRSVSSKDELWKPKKKHKTSEPDLISKKKKRKLKKKDKKKKKIKNKPDELPIMYISKEVSISPEKIQLPTISKELPISPETIETPAPSQQQNGKHQENLLLDMSESSSSSDDEIDLVEESGPHSPLQIPVATESPPVKEEVLEQTDSINKPSSLACMMTRSKRQSMATTLSEPLSNSSSGPIEECFNELESLSWPPRKGDLIAYKELEMTDNYTPAISEVRKARVLGVFGGTQQQMEKKLLLDVLWPENIIRPKLRGKFDLEYDSEPEPFPETATKNNESSISWSALIDPKLLL